MEKMTKMKEKMKKMKGEDEEGGDDKSYQIMKCFPDLEAPSSSSLLLGLTGALYVKVSKPLFESYSAQS